jgi:hypothetical protein
MWMICVSGGPLNWHFLIKTHEIDNCDKCIGRIGPEACAGSDGPQGASQNNTHQTVFFVDLRGAR